MTKPLLIEEEPMNLSQVKEQLSKIEKRDGELNFRSNKTNDYLQQVDILSKTKAKELHTKISELNVPRLKETHINKIIDLQPKTVEELKVILQGYALTVKVDNQKKLVEAVLSVTGK